MTLKLTWMLLSLVTVIGASLPAQACSYDGQFNNPFTESFPGSLDIAIATQHAIDNNHLTKIDKLEGKQGLRRTSWWLQLMAEQHADALESVAYIYLVDIHLWSKVNPGKPMEIHATPQVENTTSVLLLSEAALYALVYNSVDFDRATQLGIIHH
ncbi:hypothetical protein [Vibrio rarus]|uniref:hypothetical protein n=1 Tax=Vibrio rarus TaxID=413403 RepID=UPI0021C2D638|nr:hypothetical protein [Vibrio rarus]